MITLRMTGWREGLKTISLMKAIQYYSTGSLVTAKKLTEDLVDGEVIELTFRTEKDRDAFRREAEVLGVEFG